MTNKMYMMIIIIYLFMASSIMESSDAWLTLLIPSRLALCTSICQPLGKAENYDRLQIRKYKNLYRVENTINHSKILLMLHP